MATSWRSEIVDDWIKQENFAHICVFVRTGLHIRDDGFVELHYHCETCPETLIFIDEPLDDDSDCD